MNNFCENLLTLCLIGLTSGLAVAEQNIATHDVLWLPQIFGDHMVLQQGKDLPVWGKAKPGESVTVTVGDRSAETRAAADGKWVLRLKPLPVTQEAVQVKISSAGEQRIFDDVLIGDVWLCSGQSNMAMPINKMKTGHEEVAKANHPKLRYFKIPRSVSFDKSETVKGEWVVCTPESLTADGFSAVGYYFGTALLKDLNRPIGLIGAYDGGTRIHCWMSLESLQSFPGHRTDTAKQVNEFLRKKASLEGDMAHHKNVLLPKWEEELKAFKAEMDKRNAAWLEARAQATKSNQPIPPRPARAKIANRPLAHDGNFTLPTVLYNAKIAPLAPYALTGALWYQGEANAYPGMNEEYATLLPMLIQDWRKQWGQGDFPFLYAQLPNLNSHGGEPKYDDWWPALRESQRIAASTPNTAMVVTIDVGDPNDLHPTIKKPIAERLVSAAKKIAYGEDHVISGPMIESAERQGDKVVLRFTHTGGGLMIGSMDQNFKVSKSQGPLANFELAGADGTFAAAQAAIDGDSVLVWSDAIKLPTAVRYAWKDNPQPAVNFYNREGLPASPFTLTVNE
jgi:sialate O-acetylesterase